MSSSPIHDLCARSAGRGQDAGDHRTGAGYSLLEFLVVALAYYGGARLGLSLGLTSPYVTAVWPPSGIALAACVVLGHRVWPAIAMAAFVANLERSEPVPVALMIAAGNTLEALLGAALLRRIGFQTRLERVRDTIGLAVVGLTCTLVSACIGVAALRLRGLLAVEVLGVTWLKWWLGDAMGVLVIAPLLLTWSSRRRFAGLPQQAIEVVVLTFGLAAVTWLMFGMPLHESAAFKYLVFPFFIWAALRFDQRITAALVFAVAALAVGGVMDAISMDSIPLSAVALDAQLMLQQTFMGVVSVTALALGAAVAERRRSDNQRQELLERERAARAELSSYQQRLEELVAERTSELAVSMDQLRRSERLASLGTLSAGIAHEINNPLNSIVLAADDALTSADVAMAHSSLELIKKEALRGGRIVKSVLDFSREQRSSKTAVDLNLVLRRTMDLVRTCIERQDVSLQFDLAASLPLVLGNATELEQVVTNLVKNAVEASKGPVVVLLRTRGEREPAPRVSLTIADNGPGIPPEDLGRIFDPFYSTRVHAGGTGLGLSICHSIIMDHGGTVTVESEPGRGAAFIIRLPAI